VPQKRRNGPDYGSRAPRRARRYKCPHTTISVLILLSMCPHTTVSTAASLTVQFFSYYYICVLILLYMFAHTTKYLSSYYICTAAGPTVQVSSYYSICLLILLYTCPQMYIVLKFSISLRHYVCVLRLRLLMYRARDVASSLTTYTAEAADVSIRQHTSAYVCMMLPPLRLLYAYNMPQTHADVC
jgi:hypothetical protein